MLSARSRWAPGNGDWLLLSAFQFLDRYHGDFGIDECCIQAKLDEIDQQYPEAQAFTTTLRSMVKGFALDEFMDILRRLSTGGTHDSP